MNGIDKLIICNPYKMPTEHWSYDHSRKKFKRVNGRRPAGYLIASKDSQKFDAPGEFQKLELVNKIRPKVDAWRKNDYPNVTRITRELLTFWHH